MKLTRTFILCTIFALFFSCGGNRMKNNEKALAKQILIEEEQLAQEAARRAEREKQLADSIAKLPKGFRFKEDRSVDSNNLPVVIDIIGSRTNPKEIKLSQLFSKIEYIRLESLPDSIIQKYSNIFVVGDHHIYSFSILGEIAQYDLKGQFIQYILKREIKITSPITKCLEDAIQTSPLKNMIFYLSGDNLCYRYDDLSIGKSYFVVFDDKDQTKSLEITTNNELKNKMPGKGKIIAELSAPNKKNQFPFTPYLLNSSTFAYSQKGKSVNKPESFINITTLSGDTLCKFKDFDPIINYTKELTRGVDPGNSYYLNGILHVRQAFNDTVYQLIPPSRLIPKYVLDFGKLGIKKAYNGIDPDYDLTDKLIINQLTESNRYLFITYTQNNDSPKNAKNRSLKYSRVVYDKLRRKAIPIYTDELTTSIPDNSVYWSPSPPEMNIENDLDGLPTTWPLQVTANGKPCFHFDGRFLLNRKKDKSIPFKNLSANDQIMAIYH
jgi:hypothetical protein